MNNWHSLDIPDVLQRLGSNTAFGLSTAEANHRVQEVGSNELVETGNRRSWQILWEQLTETLVVMLLIAAGISAVLGDGKDAGGILSIVVLIVLLGFNQEYRAAQAMKKLKKLAVPTVKVRRDGRLQHISACQLVPGDLVLLEAEDLVLADCRVIESRHLRTQEAALTGKSEPADKDSKTLTDESFSLDERNNMVYMGTIVTYGQALVVVTATGMKTELGQITKMVQAVDPELTPLQKRLDRLGKGLAIAALGLIVLICILGLLQGEDARLMILTAISLAVAALPEGLPAVVAISLALGAQQLLKRHALIRKLPAVETLGSVTAICSGKTGTLTQNRMTVTVLDAAGVRLDLIAQGRLDMPWCNLNEAQPSLLSEPPALALLLAGSTLCNDAQLEPDKEEPRYFHVVGDPAEGALVLAAAQQGLWKVELERYLPRVNQIPFDLDRQRMTTVHQIPSDLSHMPLALESICHWNQRNGRFPYVAFTKGAVAPLLQISQRIWVNGVTEPFSVEWHQQIMADYQQLTENGLRVLGVAFRVVSQFPSSWHHLERDLTFIGLVGMNDPARPEAREAVMTCKRAGIRPVMITGDHPLTSQHIARELGIAIDHHILTGEELASMSIEEWNDAIERVSVFARISPQQKFEIVRALQGQGHIVAMTGDGVNDAPALKKADIGVAMGMSGTDVAREAADMVLLDDNFATIVAAVKEGRVIYDNIRKFIKYLLSSNAGEILVMLLAPFLGMPLPLLPLQILWINLLTDGLPALALSVEPAERGTMSRPPYPNENIFGRGMGHSILWIGLLLGLVSIGTGYGYWRAAHPGWQTILFTVLTLSQMGNALAIRSERDSLFQIGVMSNKPLLGAVILTLGLQLAVIYTPVLQQLFTTVPLSISDLLVSVGLSSVVFWGVELEKWLNRRKAAQFSQMAQTRAVQR